MYMCFKMWNEMKCRILNDMLTCFSKTYTPIPFTQKLLEDQTRLFFRGPENDPLKN